MSSNRLKRIKDHILSENQGWTVFINPASMVPTQCPGMATPEGSPLTTHVLNTAEGIPGSHMALSLHRLDTSLAVWSLLSTGITDDDGRCTELMTREALTAGMYKMRFETGEYWESRGQKCFYPYVEVVFTITDSTKKCHVPLLLSCFSYTTYRGS